MMRHRSHTIDWLRTNEIIKKRTKMPKQRAYRTRGNDNDNVSSSTAKWRDSKSTRRCFRTFKNEEEEEKPKPKFHRNAAGATISPLIQTISHFTSTSFHSLVIASCRFWSTKCRWRATRFSLSSTLSILWSKFYMRKDEMICWPKKFVDDADSQSETFLLFCGRPREDKKATRQNQNDSERKEKRKEKKNLRKKQKKDETKTKWNDFKNWIHCGH